MVKRTPLSEIEKKILELIEFENKPMSIREITIKLDKNYGIKKSPQVIKRYLLLLKKKDVIN